MFSVGGWLKMLLADAHRRTERWQNDAAVVRMLPSCRDTEATQKNGANESIFRADLGDGGAGRAILQRSG